MKNLALVLLAVVLASVPAQIRAQYYGYDDPQGGEYTFTIISGGANIVGYGGPPWAITIPNNFSGLPVTSIGGEAFSLQTNLTSVVIPEGVTSIGEGAFANSYALKAVTIPNSVTSIGASAFYSCESLTNAAIPASVTSLGADAFEGTALTSVTIPYGITGIGEQTFIGCGNLTNVTMPGSIAYIGEYAFAACSRLTNIMIPASVVNIGQQAFYYSANLSGIYFGGNAPATGASVFEDVTNVVAYYLLGTTGWTEFSTNTGVPVVLWNPLIQTGDGHCGVRSNQFGFNITGTSNIPIVVQASTNLLTGIWTSITNVVLTNGSYYFSDPQSSNYTGRYYRIAAP